MFRGLSVIAIAPVLDERDKVREVIRRTPREVVDEILIVDDGSSDGSPEVCESLGAKVIRLERTQGVGAALRAGFRHAVDRGFDVAVVMAGNNKDAPEEIPLLLDPISRGEAMFVQGSRFLKRDPEFGDMPLYRRVATRIHPLLFSLAARRRVTESTNGFRAIHRSVLSDSRIDLGQPWLNEYELEPYLYLRTIQLGYPTVEVPVTKIYPPRRVGQTKMKPLTGWWSILRPLVYVGLGVRR
jgi:dolichol-phosphate mannosyltransferase